MESNGTRRVLSRDVKAHAGKQVMLRGWLHKKRLIGGINFIVLRGRGGLVRIVIEGGEEN